MFKQELRSIYKFKRNSLTNNEIEDLSLSIANKVLGLDIWEYNNYHIFFPIEKHNEVDTKLIIQIIQGKDKNVILPKINFSNKKLENYLLTDSTLLKTNSLEIVEPQDSILITNDQVDVVFVPLLIFDKMGQRVGYGGGYYDKLLIDCSKAIKIGVSFFDPINEIQDINKTDVKLNFCVTPKKIYEFSG